VNDNGASVDGRDPDTGPADAVAAEIRAAGGTALANYNDVSDYEGGFGVVKAAMDEWGRLDIAVCNAGILRDRAIHNMSEDDWDGVIAVHLKGCYTVLRAAWPVFRQQRYGRVVLASSSAGFLGNFGQSNYGSAKAGMIGLMNVTKLEGDKYNICINCIGPGAMTRMTEGLMLGDRSTQMSPDLVAPAVAYLCSPACTDSGYLIEAGGGRFGRVAFVENRGVQAPDGATPSVDWVAEQWAAITDISQAVPMWGIGKTLADHKAEKAAQPAT